MKDICCNLFAHLTKTDCPLALAFRTGHNGACTSVYIGRVGLYSQMAIVNKFMDMHTVSYLGLSRLQ